MNSEYRTRSIEGYRFIMPYRLPYYKNPNTKLITPADRKQLFYKIKRLKKYSKVISLNYGGLLLAVFRQFRRIYTRYYFYPPQYIPS